MGGGVIRAVDGISLTIERGEFVALLGQSGSGKSTLLNLLAGLDRPTSGSVLVQGRDLAKMSSEELARYRRNDVGMVFQAFHLIPSMTITENVELPMRFAEVERAERAQRVRQSLERVGLGHRLEHRPSELSGGEQQRVSLARALANRPQLLLADEPTGNLDSRTGEDILNLIRDLSLSLGMTVVMVTHERALAERFAQRLIFLGRRQAAYRRRWWHEGLRPLRACRAQSAAIQVAQWIDYGRHFGRRGFAGRHAVARRRTAATGDAPSRWFGNVRHRVRHLEAGFPRLRSRGRSEDRASGKSAGAGPAGARQDGAPAICDGSRARSPRDGRESFTTARRISDL